MKAIKCVKARVVETLMIIQSPSFGWMSDGYHLLIWRVSNNCSCRCWSQFPWQLNPLLSTEPTLIAKSSILLDVKPWDDETDMAKLEECVRSIQMDGLIWGQCEYCSNTAQCARVTPLGVTSCCSAAEWMMIFSPSFGWSCDGNFTNWNSELETDYFSHYQSHLIYNIVFFFPHPVAKLVPVGYGIKKLQIGCVVEDDKVLSRFFFFPVI